jgi:hypothetical protein
MVTVLALVRDTEGGQSLQGRESENLALDTLRLSLYEAIEGRQTASRVWNSNTIRRAEEQLHDVISLTILCFMLKLT